MSDVKIKTKKRKSQAGFSLVETLPIIIVIVGLVSFLLGLWGMTHKNILGSIAARNYAFETFNHRSNLIYFNDQRAENHSYEQSNIRFHGYGDGTGGDIKAMTTPFRFPLEDNVNEPAQLHRVQIFNQAVIPDAGEGTEGTRLPWVLVGYGICLNADCGGN